MDTLYNESLEMYVIRNMQTKEYIFQGPNVDNELSDLTTYRLDKVIPFATLPEAKEYLEYLFEDFKEDDPEIAKSFQIRKIKIVDIGEVDERKAQ